MLYVDPGLYSRPDLYLRPGSYSRKYGIFLIVLVSCSRLYYCIVTYRVACAVCADNGMFVVVGCQHDRAAFSTHSVTATALSVFFILLTFQLPSNDDVTGISDDNQSRRSKDIPQNARGTVPFPVALHPRLLTHCHLGSDLITPMICDVVRFSPNG